MGIELKTRPSLLLSGSECCGAKHIIVLLLMEGSSGVRKGAWSKAEDDLLRACVEQYGEGKWHLVPMRAGLNRCRKSCRLRWLNYLEPNIKRGEFAEDEVDLMIRLHRLLGNRWSLIAGRLPGRTPNDVKNYWNTYIRRKTSSSSTKEGTNVAKPPKETAVRPHEVIKPHPRTFSRTSPWLRTKFLGQAQEDQGGSKQCTAHASAAPSECNKSWSGQWWRTVLEDKGGNDAENDTCHLGEQDWKILGDVNNWDEVLAEDGDLLIEGQSWSDTLLDINLWDS